jgi:Sec-independent protein translocase protein TatA
MALLLAGVGVLSGIVLVGLLVAFAKRLSELARAMSDLQSELLPALDAIKQTSDETRQLATQLEERARVLRRNDR